MATGKPSTRSPGKGSVGVVLLSSWWRWQWSLDIPSDSSWFRRAFTLPLPQNSPFVYSSFAISDPVLKTPRSQIHGVYGKERNEIKEEVLRAIRQPRITNTHSFLLLWRSPNRQRRCWSECWFCWNIRLIPEAAVGWCSLFWWDPALDLSDSLDHTPRTRVGPYLFNGFTELIAARVHRATAESARPNGQHHHPWADIKIFTDASRHSEYKLTGLV